GLTIVTHILKEGGQFIAKIFRGKDTSLLYSQRLLRSARITLHQKKDLTREICIVSWRKSEALQVEAISTAAVVLSKNLREPMANLRGLLTSVSSYCQRSFSQSILKSPNNLSQIQTRQTHHDDVETQSCDEYLLNQQYLCSCLL
ncbi:unnamed protein product, partial [Brassica rapa subsp. trilocularis]